VIEVGCWESLEGNWQGDIRPLSQSLYDEKTEGMECMSSLWTASFLALINAYLTIINPLVIKAPLISINEIEDLPGIVSL